MPDRSKGDEAQLRIIADQIGESAAEIAISKFVAQHPELRQGSVAAEIPAPLKWAGAIIAALFTMGTATLAFWLVTSVSDMQVTVARIDERLNSGSIKDARFEDLERRVSKNEALLAEMQPARGSGR